MNKNTSQAGNNKAFIALPLIIFLAACTGQQKLANDLHEYQQRLASVLNVPSQVLQKPTLPPYPSIKILKKEIPQTRIKLAEFYALKNCQLSTLVAERNTVLGRTQYPSARYIYEVDLIQEIERCLTTSETSETSATLRNWQRQKQNNLPLVWANLLQTSDEVKLALSANSGFIQGTEKDGIHQTVQAFEYLFQLLDNPQSNSNNLERHLANIKNYQLPARMWRSQLLLTDNLKQITVWLENNSLLMKCPSRKASIEVEYLQNIFKLFFIEKIQPVATRINHYQYQLTPVFENLAVSQNTDMQIKNMLIMHSQQNFIEYEMSIKAHIQFWQKLYKRCGITPNG
ncbi:MAG: hypothetical protein ACI88A_002436 [Paraglaciecola sp.]